MKKIIKFLIFVILLWMLNQSFSAWYWNHAVWYSNPGWTALTHWTTAQWYTYPSWPNKWTRCNSDWDTTWWGNPSLWEVAIALNNSSITKTPHSDSELTIASSWNMRCLYWDWRNPESLSVSYTAWWTNSAKTITVKAKDRWGSRLKKMVLQQSQNWWSWTTVKNWDNLNSQNTIITKTWTRSVINWSNFKYRLIAYDYAWNYIYKYNNNLIRFDTTPPIVGYTISWDVTTNNTWANLQPTYHYVKASINCTDTGGSWCTWQQYRIESSTFTCNSSWTWNTWTNKSFTAEWIKYICFRSKDVAWNGYVYSSVATIKIDTTPPTASDIWNSNPINNSILLAVNPKNFSFSVWTNWGSPITYIWSFFENYSTTNSLKNIETSSNWTWSKNENIENVDKNRQSNWTRQYTLRVTKICDEAWNCTWNTSKSNTLKDFTYNVYANNIDTTKTTITWINDLNSWNSIADWTPYAVKINLKDQYWNEIVKVNWIRNVKLTYNYNNSLYTNQYPNKYGNWVLIDWANSNFWNNKNKIYNNKTNWYYETQFQVYAPTINWNNFKINSIIWNLSDNSFWDTTLNSTINFNFKPLYTTTFSWKQKTNWFIEWVTQTWGILTILKESWWRNISSWNIKLEKAWSNNIVDDDLFNWTWELDNSWKKWFLQDWIKSFYNLNIWNKNFTTLFTLDPHSPTIKDIKDLYVKSWINYTIDWKNITYAWDIIWWTANAANAWIKIYWNTNISDKKTRDITTNQDSTSIHNVNWKITKSKLKSQIRSNTYRTIKYLNKNTETNVTNAKNIWTNYLYYDLRSDTNKLLTLTISDLNKDKTIIVYWWNLYITCNWTNCSTTWNYFPGIIIMKDNNWNWGKLYIDPKVSRIDAAIYVDKSIISYNNIWWEISPNNWGTYTVLKNQLYIHGSVFSENTIGGARLSPPVCPYYEKNSCTLDKAQKYDLNYLRRWIENKSISTLWDYPVIIEYNSKLQLNPPALFSN